jgi:hypothetical protein
MTTNRTLHLGIALLNVGVALATACNDREVDSSQTFPYTAVEVAADGSETIVASGTLTRAQQLDVLDTRRTPKVGNREPATPPGTIAYTMVGACSDTSTFLLASGPNWNGTWYCVKYASPDSKVAKRIPFLPLSYDGSHTNTFTICGPSDASGFGPDGLRGDFCELTSPNAIARICPGGSSGNYRFGGSWVRAHNDSCR